MAISQFFSFTTKSKFKNFGTKKKLGGDFNEVETFGSSLDLSSGLRGEKSSKMMFFLFAVPFLWYDFTPFGQIELSTKLLRTRKKSQLKLLLRSLKFLMPNFLKFRENGGWFKKYEYINK